MKYVILREKVFSSPRTPVSKFDNSPGGRSRWLQAYLPFRLLGIGGVSKRWHLLKGKSSSHCQIYSSDLKDWCSHRFELPTTLCRFPSRPLQPFPFFVPFMWWGEWRWIPCLWCGLRNLYWGPISTKGQLKGYIALHPLIIPHRSGHELEPSRPCLPATQFSYNAMRMASFLRYK